MKLLVKYKDYETLKQYLIILTKELKDINCNNINIKINKYGFLYDNKQTSIWNSSIKIIGRIISFPNDVIESIILDNNLEFAKELIK